MVVELTAPLRWNGVVFNAGESVKVPDELAAHLIGTGHARAWTLETVAKAVEGPPADRLMRQQRKKAVH